MASRTASGVGLATVTGDGQVLDTWYPQPTLADLTPDADHAALLTLDGTAAPHGLTRTRVVRTQIDLDAPPVDAADAYLRLHLLSLRLVEPNTIDLEGMFGVIANVAWTSIGPLAPADLDAARLAARGTGAPLLVHGLDKFPRMLDYVTPTGVRVADADRVRLGAHLAHGTTVMHEGFVNFNAGTLGPSMVEGRISQGVVVGSGSDIGGGASIMGTLSGGGSHRITIGQRCLLGANSGLGISLGDDCVIEAGLYVTSGTKVAVTAADGERVVAARDLSGVSGILFRRHSQTGAVQAVPRTGGVPLNEALHSSQ